VLAPEVADFAEAQEVDPEADGVVKVILITTIILITMTIIILITIILITTIIAIIKEAEEEFFVEEEGEEVNNKTGEMI